MSAVDFLVSIAAERQTRLAGRATPDPVAFALWERALLLRGDESYQRRLREAYAFAKSLEYAHEGLAGDIYIAHPIRVAAMALLARPDADADLGVVGLLHNTLEVSSISRQDLAARFGAGAAEQIFNLTVDRKQQWDARYKQWYYDRLNAGAASARIVKVFDKLDNLFLLGLNPDDGVRDRYLREIENHVLPMAEQDLPQVLPYMIELVADCHRAGYFGPDR
jgi:(p)ppGpp synthase/HD superfamily hydrolase